MSTSGGFRSLQMVSEPITGRCAGLLAVSRRGVDTRRCASKVARPQRVVDLGTVPHRLDKRMSASEDAGARRGVIVMSLIGWREEQITLYKGGPEGGWIVMSHIGWRGEQITLYKGVETFP